MPYIQGVHKCVYIYIYFNYWRGKDTKASPLAFWLAYPTLIVCRNLNNSAIWLLPPRCSTLLKHICKLTTWMRSFSGWFAWFWSLCIPYSIWIPAQPLGDSFFPLQWGGAYWRPCGRERRSWVLQWNTRKAATCGWHFRCADQSSSPRTNGLLPNTVWKIVLFGKWIFYYYWN